MGEGVWQGETHTSEAHLQPLREPAPALGAEDVREGRSLDRGLRERDNQGYTFTGFSQTQGKKPARPK